MNINDVKLTEYSHGAGCGCKIAPDVLDKILKSDVVTKEYPNLLVGNSSNDDAAAFDIGDGTCVLSTTDFFMPIVDDPYTFGKIAATNAISDVYAMGGKPIMAIAILGWPIKVLDVEIAKKVVEGGKAVCEAANIPLSGGHSIDSPEPIFGLAVTGIVQKENLKQNNKAKPGCSIFLTKPLGIGILSTAQKKKKIEPGHIEPAVNAMCTLNSIGAKISQLNGVVALTDVTGFGLCGHLNEICNGSNISATIEYNKVPLLENTIKYYEMGCIPGGTKNNYACYKDYLGEMTDEQKMILCDAQTSGGLLVIVENDKVDEFKKVTSAEGLSLEPIGYTTKKQEKNIYVK